MSIVNPWMVVHTSLRREGISALVSNHVAFFNSNSPSCLMYLRFLNWHTHFWATVFLFVARFFFRECSHYFLAQWYTLSNLTLYATFNRNPINKGTNTRLSLYRYDRSRKRFIHPLVREISTNMSWKSNIRLSCCENWSYPALQKRTNS